MPALREDALEQRDFELASRPSHQLVQTLRTLGMWGLDPKGPKYKHNVGHAPKCMLATPNKYLKHPLRTYKYPKHRAFAQTMITIPNSMVALKP